MIDNWLRRTQQPGWPLAFLMVGYPLWWILGLTQVAVLVSCLMMAYTLLHGRRIAVPRGFVYWVLFLVVVLVGASVVQVVVPGALPGTSFNRYLTWAVRALWYVEVTVVLLYVADQRDRISGLRVARIFSVMFVTIVVGGLLGTLWPTLRLTSAIELMLPDNVAANAFVQSQIHPVLAERQVYQSIAYRPSGPFPFANEWGINFAVFLPFFVLAWCRRDAGWRRYVAPFVLLLALVPVVYSLNRGLWATLIVAGVLFGVLQIRVGKGRRTVMLAAVMVPALLLVALSPLGGVLSERFSGHNSNVGRANLSALSVEGMLQTSPVVGLGTTRRVEGTFYSIAGGSTTNCPTCAPPALGTQGFLWSLIFSNGVAGLLLCLTFFAGVVWRHRRPGSGLEMACLSVLVSFLLTMPIYDWSITTGVVVMTSVGLLSHFDPVRLPRRGMWLGSWRLVAACCAIGMVAAGAWQLHHGSTYAATASVWVPSPANSTQSMIKNPEGSPTDQRAPSLDTEARYLYSPGVLKAIRPLQALDLATGRGDLQVAAEPNSRILLFHYTSSNRERARQVVELASHTYVQERTTREALERRQTEEMLLASARGMAEATAPLRAATRALVARGGQAVPAAMLRVQLGQQVGSLAVIEQQMREAQAVARSSRVVTTVVGRRPEQWNVALGTGAVLGLLLAGVLTAVGRLRNERVSRLLRRSPWQWHGVPMAAADDSWSSERIMARLGIGPATGDLTWLSAEPDNPSTCLRAERLDELEEATSSSANPLVPGVVLVTSGEARRRSLESMRRRTEAQGLPVKGLLVLDRSPLAGPTAR